jgi:hypothetical protein
MENYPHQPPERLPDDIRAWARQLRCRMTDTEMLLWKIVRDRRMCNAKFRRQHPMGRYILDFYCHEKSWQSNSMAVSTQRRRIMIGGGMHGC